MIQYSPYLSDTVLLAILDPHNNFPSGIIKQLLIANSPLTYRVRTAVEERIPALPAGVINIINNAQEGTSERSLLYESIDEALFQLRSLNSELIWYSYETKLDSAFQVLKSDTSVQGLYNLFPFHLLTGNALAADSTLKKIKSISSDSLSYPIWMADNNLRLLKDSLSVEELGAMEWQRLSAFADSSETAYKAKAFIKAVSGKKNKKYPYGDQATQIRNRIQSESPAQESETRLTIYPNPTNEYLNYRIEDYGVNLTLELRDAFGKVLIFEKTEADNGRINIQSISPGVYFLLLKNNEVMLDAEKVLIYK